MGNQRRSRERVQLWLLVAFPIVLLAAILLPGLMQGGVRPTGERSPVTLLKTVAMAQADFRKQEGVENGRKSFWRADIAGLYAVKPKAPADAPALKLIELAVACADDRPVTDLASYGVPGMKGGYWYRALLHEDEKTPNPDRFAACAFPDTSSAGKWTYIVDEDRVIYRKALGPQRGIEVYPKDPLKAGWEEVD